MFSKPDRTTSSSSNGGLFARLKASLSRTASGLTNLLRGSSRIDADSLEELEMALLSADVGIDVTQAIIRDLQTTAKQNKQISLREVLSQQMLAILRPVAQPLQIQSQHKPFCILMVGVNGVGKTTTIGKLTQRWLQDNHSVMLAAGDTFRAAAVEQLQIWGERHQVPVMAQKTGADSAAVIFDAMQSAKARHTDILIADTAGRLHTKSNLMEELKKVKRTMARQDPTAPHEVLLVLDAGTGQNALQQAIQFHEAVGVTGIVLTKLDGTAKGGIILAIAQKLAIPIRFIGVGESAEDLRPFNAEEFVAALLGDESVPKDQT